MGTEFYFLPGRTPAAPSTLPAFFLSWLLVMLLFTPARTQILYDAPQLNPFGIPMTPTENDLVFHALTDIDGDEDLDIFVSHRVYNSGCWMVTTFEFFENRGTTACPEFVKVPGQTFGLPALTAVVTFVDIDNDGDQDAFISNHCMTATISYHENTGGPKLPLFSSTPTATINTSGWGIAFAMLNFGDLDGDGDFDALVNGLRPAEFRYLENTGTPSSYSFGFPVSDPFGLGIPFYNSSEWSHFSDVDCDGDLDILNAHWQGGNHNNWKLYFHENTGSRTAPAFAPPVATERTIIPIALADLDGDGDEDILADEYYYRNISEMSCVTLPTAAFSWVQDGLTVEYINQSTGQGTACNPVTYLWNFGDGTFSDSGNPSHTYAKDGTYTVCLTVNDIAGEKQFCTAVTAAASATGEALARNAIRLYPNPATEVLFLQFAGIAPGGDAVLEMINPLGDVVRRTFHRGQDWSADVRIDLGGLANGAYTLRIRWESNYWCGRFVKT